MIRNFDMLNFIKNINFKRDSFHNYYVIMLPFYDKRKI